MKIRKILPQDLPLMLRIWNQNYRHLTTSNKKHSLNSLEKWYTGRSKGKHEYYGYFEGKNLLGFMITKDNPKTFFVKMLAVDKNSNSRGIGTKLINHATLAAENKKNYCETKIENFKVIPFLVKRNFLPVKLDKKYAQYIFQYKPLL